MTNPAAVQPSVAVPRSAAPLDEYAERGFAVVPGLLTPAEVDDIRRETVGVFRGARGAVEGIVPSARKRRRWRSCAATTPSTSRTSSLR